MTFIKYSTTDLQALPEEMPNWVEAALEKEKQPEADKKEVEDDKEEVE